MSAIGSSYRIHTHEPVCAATGRALEPGERVVAVLIERPEDGTFERLEYDPEAWAQAQRPSGTFAHWSAVVRTPSEAPRPVIGEDEATEMFESGEGLDSRVRYVLALRLIRRKRLVYLGSDGVGDARVMRVRASGKTEDNHPEIEVADPGLTDEDLEPIAAQLGMLLGDEPEA